VDDPRIELEVALRREATWVDRAELAALAAGTAAVIACLGIGGTALFASSTLVLALVTAMALRRVVPAAPRLSTLVVDRHAARIDAEVMPVADIDDVTVLPREHHVDLEIVLRRGRRIAMQTKDLASARTAIDLLGLGVRQRTMVRRIASRANHPALAVPVGVLVVGFWPAVLVNGAITSSPHVAGAMALAILGAVGAAFAAGLVPTRLTVGADGVTLSWLGWRRSVALRDVTDVTVVPATLWAPGTVRLTLRSGGAFDVSVGTRGRNPFEPFVVADECARIAERIRDAVRDVPSETPDQLSRWRLESGRAASPAWLSRLREARAASYRSGAMALTDGELVGVVHDATAEPELRATAAVAIAGDPTLRPELRRAATKTALPRLRVVLAAAADGDDEEMLEAIAELERASASSEPKARTRPDEG
jgi:hypothetical protein